MRKLTVLLHISLITLTDVELSIVVVTQNETGAERTFVPLVQ